MQLVPWVLVLLVVLLGGFIAFLADRLGRTLGKKRLSLLGLRPRHTAEIMTVGAGVLIPLVTFGIIMLGSKEVRDWFRAGPAIIQERNRLLTEVSAFRKTQEELTDEIEAAREDLARSQERLTESQEKEQQLQTRLAALQQQVQSEQARNQQLQAQNSRLSRQTAELRQSLASLRPQLVSVQQELSKTQQGLTLALSEKASAEKDRAAALRDREEAYASWRQIDEQNQELERLYVQASQKVEAIEDRIAEKEQEVQAKETELERLNLRADALKAEIAGLNQDLALAQVTLGANVEVTRKFPMTFRMGEEVARLKIDPSMTEFRVRLAVNQLLDLALKRGQERGVTGLIDVFPEQIDEVVRQLTGKDVPLVLTAHSLLNIFQGEQLPLRIMAWENPIVYRSGQVVAEEQIDGRQPEEQILRQVSEFLGTRLREQALKDQMLLSAENEASMIPITPEQVFAIVRTVKNSARTVRLVALAEQETRASDPLKLHFLLR
jgi:uncharacterized protein (DUF3084 family)